MTHYHDEPTGEIPLFRPEPDGPGVGPVLVDLQRMHDYLYDDPHSSPRWGGYPSPGSRLELLMSAAQMTVNRYRGTVADPRVHRQLSILLSMMPFFLLANAMVIVFVCVKP